MRMSVSVIWIGFAVFVVIAIAWIVRALKDAKLSFVGLKTEELSRGGVESDMVEDLIEVKYHYQSAAGFVDVWEFIEAGGGSLWVVGDGKGMGDVLAKLESILGASRLGSSKKRWRRGTL